METVAQELMRAIRGSVSQLRFSKKLGYLSNTATDWETGRRFPTGHEALRAASLVGIDVHEVLGRFASSTKAFVDQCTSSTDQSGILAPEQLSQWLKHLSGKQKILTLSEKSELSRFQISRILSGKTQPRLPEFLRVVQACTGRMIDFVELLVSIDKVPSLRAEAMARQAQKKLAFEAPWTEAIVLVLQSEEYRCGCENAHPFLARYLGLDAKEVARSLDLLETARIIEWNGTHFVNRNPISLDTKAETEVFRQHRLHWMKVAQSRVSHSTEGASNYNVFSCSKEDYEKITQLQRELFQQVRAIVASSERDEIVGLLQNNLVMWGQDRGKVSG